MFYIKEEEKQQDEKKPCKTESEADIEAAADEADAAEALYNACEQAAANAKADEIEYDPYTGKILFTYSRRRWQRGEPQSADSLGEPVGFYDRDELIDDMQHDVQAVSHALESEGWHLEVDASTQALEDIIDEVQIQIQKDDYNGREEGFSPISQNKKSYDYTEYFADAVLEIPAHAAKALKESKFQQQLAGWLDMLDVCR